MKTIYKKLLFLLLFLPLGILAQTLEGTVTDQGSKQPLPGVNVVVKGSPSGTQTDFDGKFKLTGVKKGDVIVFSYLGYKNASVTYNSQANVVVAMQEESNQLTEVVVLGYGSVKKKDATGSVTLISAKDFNKGPVVSAEQLLTGKAPGVRITTNGGAPDSAPNIRIRGGSSLSSSNDPLIVVDGVPIDNTNPAGVANPFSLLNPNDIDSFSILKDASATAIYGSRASNGVIIITTKKGSSGAPQFNYSASTSIGYVTDSRKIQMMDGPNYTRFIQNFHPELTRFLGIDDPAYPGENVAGQDNPLTPEVEGRILYNTDWQEAIYRNSYSYEHNLSARANLFKKLPFRASVGYVNSEGLVKTNDYERISGSLKLTPMLFNDHLKIDMNAKVFRSEKNVIDEGGVFGGALNMDPTKPIYGASPNNRFVGYYQATKLDAGTGRYNIDGQTNPLAILEQRQRPEAVEKLLGNIEFDYKLHFFPDLRAILNLGIEASLSNIEETFANNSLQTYRFNAETDPDTNYLFNPGINYREDQTITNKTMDAYLAYTKNLKGFVSRVDAQAGYSYQNFVNDGYKSKYIYNLTTGLREVDVDKQNPNNRYYNVSNLQSFFGRANVDLANKYLFTLTFRADASSLFSKENRWGYFPAAGFAWKIADESFLENSKTISDLKLRLGYGITGQQNISLTAGSFYPYTPIFAAGNPQSQYLPGINTYSAKPYDSSLTWETTTTYNAGIDFAFFKNSALSGSVDVYRRVTEDLLAKVPGLPGQSLTNEFIANVGSMTNKGVEVSLAVKVIDTENLNWELSGNIAYNVGEVTDLKGVSEILADESSLPNGTGVKIGRHVVGEQPYSAWVFEQIYDQAGNPIQGAFVDRNGDGKISNDDRYNVAFRPNWTFGFGTSFNYKNWDLNASFRGQLDGKVYNSRNLVAGYVDRVVPINTNSLSNILANEIPFTNVQGNIQYSDYFLEDAAFLRCENITLGYKFPKFFKSASARFYVAANNLFIVTKYSGQDPENFNGIDNNFYPRPTVYSFGVSLDF